MEELDVYKTLNTERREKKKERVEELPVCEYSAHKYLALGDQCWP